MSGQSHVQGKPSSTARCRVAHLWPLGGLPLGQGREPKLRRGWSAVATGKGTWSGRVTTPGEEKPSKHLLLRGGRGGPPSLLTSRPFLLQLQKGRSRHVTSGQQRLIEELLAEQRAVPEQLHAAAVHVLDHAGSFEEARDVIQSLKATPRRTSAPIEASKPVTDRLLRAVRGSCSVLEGTTRDQMRSKFEAAAEVRGLSADELIDMAMGADWQASPTHSAFDIENPSRTRDYERLVSGE